MRTHDYDLAVIGGSFAGLACARTAARRGLRVLVLDRKADPGAQVRTTGLVVKEAAERWEIPASLTRRVRGARLYAPSGATLDLASPGYYFLATDTPALMRWLAREACRAGAHLRFARRYHGAVRTRDGFVVNGSGQRVRWLVGADGPRSAVAAEFGLGRNRAFLAGAESEWRGVAGLDPDRLHCFLDGRLAPGYIAWVVPGHDGLVQVGLAARRPATPDLAAFERRVATLFDFTRATRTARRGGLIPVGGPVAPFAAERVLLVGDAAGLVSPLSAGGIHTALDSGFAAAHALADHLDEGACEPGRTLARALPHFTAKRWLRAAFDAGIPDAAFDALIGTRAFNALARSVYFHHRGLRSLDGWRDLAHALLRGAR